LSPHLEALSRAFATPVSGPTYRPLTRALAVVLVAGLLGWGGWMLGTSSPEPLGAARLGAGAVIALALLWPMPSLLFGRTVVDATGVRQLGWMGREAAWSEVQRVRFVRMPMSPRLLVSIGIGRMKVFYSGSAELDDAFERAVRLLTAPRGESTG
jgi:hypothetical protein